MKTFVLLSLLALVSAATAPASAGPCCAAKGPVAPAIAADFSRDSLYRLEARFTNDRGEEVALGSLRGRPVAVAMFFASCTYACPLIVADLTRVRDALPAGVREETVILLVSFDTERDTVPALHRYREERLLDERWALWRGDASAIRELATLLGVNYRREIDGQFAHTNLITVLNREGEIVHHRAGLTGGLDAVVTALAAQATR